MSNSYSDRAPPWPGLGPPDLHRLDVSLQTREAILRPLGLSGRLLALAPDGGGSPILYRYEDESGAVLAIKRIAPSRRVSILQAEELAVWLLGRGVPVVAPTCGTPLVLPSGELLVAAPFLEGRPVMPHVSELHLLGAALAKLHDTLANHPETSRWREATLARLAVLEATLSIYRDRERTDCARANRLSVLSQDSALLFDLPAHPAMPLHGDFHPGNVLVADGCARIFDFEDVRHSVLPAVYELLLAVERFVLVAVEDDDAAVTLGCAFMAAYADARITGAKIPPFDGVSVLRSLALRSLLTLAAAENGQDEPLAAEWRKFFFLEESARRRARVIEKICRTIDQ
jgi:Ser/Thr protein kinase RdoA (MazF antagonist)